MASVAMGAAAEIGRALIRAVRVTNWAGTARRSPATALGLSLKTSLPGGGAGAESALPGMTSSRGCPADHPGVACLGNEGLSARQVRPVEGRLRTAAVRPG